jgi:agmatine deiminase
LNSPVHPSSAAATPRQDGFYLPADDGRLGRVWLPWPGETEANLRTEIAGLAQIISDFAPVSILAAPGDEKNAHDMCRSSAEIEILDHQSSRLRDTGPAFLIDGKGGSAAVDWRFNGWGGRGAFGGADIELAHSLLGIAEVRRFRAPLTVEGSAFVSDGRDTLIALAPAVFDEKRNPNVSRMEAFSIFMYWLGTARVIWLEDAHSADALLCDVRSLAAFIEPGVVAVSAAHDDHPHGESLRKTAERLSKASDARGEALELVTLPTPPPLQTPGAAPVSYTGFASVNGTVLVPTYDVPADARAADILAGAFENHSVTQVPARALAEAGLSLPSLILPHQARLLERDRATILPRSAWGQEPPDVDALLQKYIDMAEADD